MVDLLPCPFCGGNAKISWADVAFGGFNGNGNKKTAYRFQGICNKCHSRGKPVKSDWLIDCNPWESSYTNRNYRKSDRINKQDEMIKPYVDKAIAEWNKRGDCQC